MYTHWQTLKYPQTTNDALNLSRIFLARLCLEIIAIRNRSGSIRHSLLLIAAYKFAPRWEVNVASEMRKGVKEAAAAALVRYINNKRFFMVFNLGTVMHRHTHVRTHACMPVVNMLWRWRKITRNQRHDNYWQSTRYAYNVVIIN